MDDVLAHAFERRFGFSEGRVGAAGHDRQRAGDGTDFAAGHRGIHEIDAGGSEIDPDPAGGGGGDGAHVHRHQPRCHALRRAAHDFGDVRRIGDHRDHQFIALRGLRRAAAPLGAGVEQRLHRFGAARPDSELVAALEQVEGHRAPHDPEADESDLHDVLPKT